MRFYDVISLVLAIGAIAWFIWIVAKPHSQRKTEDSARAFFDRHGHWPDEEPPKA